MLSGTCRRIVLGSQRSYTLRSGTLTRSLSASAASRPGASSGFRRNRFAALAITGTLSGSLFLYWRQPIRADAQYGDSQEKPRQPTPLSALVRSYIVYSMCSIPMLVDHSPSILSTLMSVPFISRITEAFVRKTFFNQFVGGDTAEGTLPLLEQLRSENKGALFAYSVEVDEDEAAGKVKAHGAETGQSQPVHKRIVDEMIRCIDVAADFEDQRLGKGNNAIISAASGRRTWVAVKLTALVPDAQSLINFSKHLVSTRPPSVRPVCFPGSPRPSDFDILNSDPLLLSETCPLTKEDLEALRELKDDLYRVCTRAKERGVKIIIDAEHSWYQPSIDAFQFLLMSEFNRLPSKPSPSILSRVIGKRSVSQLQTTREEKLVQPLIYGTFQAYLRRTPEHLAQSLLDAKAHNFSLGVKLVRGAYYPFEVSAYATRRLSESDAAVASTTSVLSSLSISPEELPPVWENKAETDENYNKCARMLIEYVSKELSGARASEAGMKVPELGVLFGTHNWRSCDIILNTLVQEGLATRSQIHGEEIISIADDTAERVTMGQLYGMGDALTDYLVGRTHSSEPFVIKYVPYGELMEVMPYLGRRAIENKSVLGNGSAREERRRAGSEIVKRIYSLFA